MEKAMALGDSLGECAATRNRLEPPLSAAAEEDLRRLAQKWAPLIENAASFEQPLRFMLEFVGQFSDRDQVSEKRGERVERG